MTDCLFRNSVDGWCRCSNTFINTDTLIRIEDDFSPTIQKILCYLLISLKISSLILLVEILSPFVEVDQFLVSQLIEQLQILQVSLHIAVFPESILSSADARQRVLDCYYVTSSECSTWKLSPLRKSCTFLSRLHTSAFTSVTKISRWFARAWFVSWEIRYDFINDVHLAKSMNGMSDSTTYSPFSSTWNSKFRKSALSVFNLYFKSHVVDQTNLFVGSRTDDEESVHEFSFLTLSWDETSSNVVSHVLINFSTYSFTRSLETISFNLNVLNLFISFWFTFCASLSINLSFSLRNSSEMSSFFTCQFRLSLNPSCLSDSSGISWSFTRQSPLSLNSSSRSSLDSHNTYCWHIRLRRQTSRLKFSTIYVSIF